MRLFQPQGKLSPYVQGIWSFSVPTENTSPQTQWLPADACSSILFNLTENIIMDDSLFTEKVILSPVETRSHSKTWQPGTQLAGVRFYPGVGFGIFGELYDQPLGLPESDLNAELKTLHHALAKSPNHFSRIIRLYRWLESLDLTQTARLSEEAQSQMTISQRQQERRFRKLLGITPKHYQRIARIRRVQTNLKHQPNVELSEMALEHGFSDQAHMTREFKQIVRITPNQYRKLISRNP
ncbi:AraC family transcriptional regulator [Hydrogenovibrio marinus]|nr:AraC family transcriptional regulator [Hydrogenovibrio marinus]